MKDLLSLNSYRGSRVFTAIYLLQNPVHLALTFIIATSPPVVMCPFTYFDSLKEYWGNPQAQLEAH